MGSIPVGDSNFTLLRARVMLIYKFAFNSGGGGGGEERGAGARENRGREGYGRREREGREGGDLRGLEAGEKCETLII